MKLWHARFAAESPNGDIAVREEDFYMPTEGDVRRKLRGNGCWPIEIHQRRKPLLEWMDVRSRDWQLQLLRALRFQTATASAGTALLNIIENEDDGRRRLAFLPTRTVLKGGGSFSHALRELKLFDPATMAIITAGEHAGDLKGVIAHAIQHIEEKGRQLKAFTAALGWLAFDISSVLSAVWGAQFGFIPYLRQSGTKSQDPEALLRFNQAIDRVSFINGALMVISTGATLLVCFGSVSFWVNRHRTDHFGARMIKKIPMFSAYLRDSSMNDTCKLMSRLLRGAVPLDEALVIVRDSSIEPTVRGYWDECHRRIMTGVETARALARAPLNKAEKDQIFTVQSVDQLIDVYESIADERLIMSKDGQRRIVVMGVVILMVLFGAVVLTMIYLLMIQNDGFVDSLKDLRG